MNRCAKKWSAGLVAIAAAVLILVWPVGSWLQYKGVWRNEEEGFRGVIYLVAGARGQERRIEALLRYLSQMRSGGLDSSEVSVLIGNDTRNDLWSDESQRTLTRTEPALERLGKICDDREIEIMLVPGQLNGTDEEMRMLVEYLTARSPVQDIVLVTSPFHVRRAVWRFRKHADSNVMVSAIVADAKWSDRAPWVVAVEMLKMARDGIGLSRAGLLSRK
jgi:hypothetical protein